MIAVWWILLSAVIVFFWVQMSIRRESINELMSYGDEGANSSALVLHDPGLIDFQSAITGAFVDTLIKSGWQVDCTTTSNSAPVNHDEYDLIVLGVNTHWSAPDLPTQRYIERISSFSGTPVVVLLAGSTTRAERQIRASLTQADADIIGIHPFWLLRRNDGADWRTNRRVALQKARDIASDLARRLAHEHDEQNTQPVKPLPATDSNGPLDTHKDSTKP